MSLDGEVCVVTGAGSGIGRAMAAALAARGARVLCADIRGHEEAAEGIGGIALRCDVTSDAEMAALAARAEAEGPVALFVSNAGIMVEGGAEAPDADWTRALDVNALSHVRAARHALPPMLSRGRGHLSITASAAGLLTQIGAAPYAVSKHAAVAVAEWLAITHGGSGVGVSVLCPQAVATPMTEGGAGTAGVDGILTAEEVAEAWIDGIASGALRILPHPQVATYARRRAEDPERWAAGMRRLAAR